MADLPEGGKNNRRRTPPQRRGSDAGEDRDDQWVAQRHEQAAPAAVTVAADIEREERQGRDDEQLQHEHWRHGRGIAQHVRRDGYADVSGVGVARGKSGDGRGTDRSPPPESAVTTKVAMQVPAESTATSAAQDRIAPRSARNVTVYSRHGVRTVNASC